VDENLPIALAKWLCSQSGIQAGHFRELGLVETPDRDIFLQAGQKGSIIVSKDDDFANLVTTLGAPPQVVWVRTGNVRTSSLLKLFEDRLSALMEHVRAGSPLVAIE
jgi:predicted nuclease of predicted toxin-antitoxin system